MRCGRMLLDRFTGRAVFHVHLLGLKDQVLTSIHTPANILPTCAYHASFMTSARLFAGRQS